MTELKPIGEFLPEAIGRRRSKPTPDEVGLSERDQLVLDLVEVGIGVRKAENLVSHFPKEQIQKQLRWLPFRAARRPASLLISAIEHDYDSPAYASDK